MQPGAVQAAVLADEQARSRRDEAREAMVRELEGVHGTRPTGPFVSTMLRIRRTDWWPVSSNRAGIRSLAQVAEVENAHCAARCPVQPAPPDAQSFSLASLADDLSAVWAAPTTDARLKKRIVRAVIEEAIADLDDETSEIVLVLHWAGGAHTEHRLPKTSTRTTKQRPAEHSGGGTCPRPDCQG